MCRGKLMRNLLFPVVYMQMAIAGGGGASATAAAAAAKHAGFSNQRVVLPSLTAALLLVAMPLLIWTIDTTTIHYHSRSSSFLKPQDYLLRTITAASPLQQPSNLTVTDTTARAPSPSPESQNPPASAAAPPAAAAPAAASSPRWISVDLEADLTSTLLSRWRTPGGEPCRESRTTNITIAGLDDRSSTPVELPAGEIHQFLISALDESGNPRCLGGDYFETDISGAAWKSRPPVSDHGNGSYTLLLQVHPDFAGDYNLTVVLLFRSFEGLKFSPERFAFRRELRKIPIRFYRSSDPPSRSPPPLRHCRAGDFRSREVWSGRWTRHGGDDQCQIGNDGRYRCLPPRFPCRKPWCRGPLGSLESNGWVYSAHCSFRIFRPDAAWRCLRGRWLLFWGDSNHVDTIRNLLNFVLGVESVKAVPRRFDANFTNPRRPSESVRITSIFNGHWNETKNYQGLFSLQNEGFRDLVKKYFSGESGRVPDTVVLNSGLHDGVYWRSIRAFAEGAEYAAEFWDGVVKGVKEKGFPAPEIFYRTTIATGGYARDLAFNPSKMEAFNGVVVEKMRKRGLLTGGVVDEFDMTFPWHWDNRCNDGVHYGRAPAKARWRDGGIGHQYFVDLMLAHVLLNAICNDDGPAGTGAGAGGRM